MPAAAARRVLSAAHTLHTPSTQTSSVSTITARGSGLDIEGVVQAFTARHEQLRLSKQYKMPGSRHMICWMEARAAV
jgi:hypothetical protein